MIFECILGSGMVLLPKEVVGQDEDDYEAAHVGAVGVELVLHLASDGYLFIYYKLS